jgi:hypothetical protein
MKNVWLLIAWIAFTAPLARADGDLKLSGAETRNALHSIITQQLEAFRAGNYGAAYTYADDELKAVCSLQMFERMVQKGYPEIAHSVAANCGLTVDNGEDAVVSVRVRGSDDKWADYQYMLHWRGAKWRISGVVVCEKPVLEV